MNIIKFGTKYTHIIQKMGLVSDGAIIILAHFKHPFLCNLDINVAIINVEMKNIL